MRKLWLIVKREYVTRVRTKGFVIATVGVPLFSIGLFAFSIFVATRQTDHTLKLAILDYAGGLGATVSQGLNHKLPNGQPEFSVVRIVEQSGLDEEARNELRAAVNRGQLDAYLAIPRDVSSNGSAEFHTKNPGDLSVIEHIGRAVSDAVVARRLRDRGLNLDNVSEVVRSVDLKLVKVTQQGETEEKGQTFLMAVILATVLYTTLIMYGVLTMRSVLEEKTTRIVEVLVSAAKPFQLMAGKIVGVAAVGLTQYLIWAITAALLATYGAAMAAAFRPGASFPRFHLPASLLTYFVVFFLCGYFLYASLFAAIGASSSSDQDAQQLQWPVMLPIICSFVMFNIVLRDPNSTASVVLSLIPFFAPILMTLRLSAQAPPSWQIGLSIALTAVTTVGVVYFSAKIYRVGMLMYGKRPSVVELLRWLRYS
jgi:ABC-2 type transport system permease protein